MNPHLQKPVTLALLYGFFATIWILFSSYLISFITEDPALLTYIELAKGLVFVGTTSAVLYFILREKITPSPKAATSSWDAGSKGAFAVIIALMLLVPLVGYGVLELYAPVLKRQTFSDLQSIAALQEDAINLWQRERQGDLLTLKETAAFNKDIEAIIAAPDSDTKARIKDRLNAMRTAYNYSGIAVYDSAMNLVISTGHTKALPKASEDLAKEVLASPDGIQQVMSIDPAENDVRVDFIAPLSSDSTRGTMIGFVVAVNYPSDALFRHISDLPGDFSTIETLFIRKSTDGVWTFHLTQKPGDEPRLAFYPVGSDALSETVIDVETAQAQLDTTDHHGINVLAISRPFADTPWHLVAKIDKQEAFQPMRHLAAWLSIVVFAALVVISALLLMVWRQQRRSYHLSIIAQQAAHQQALLEKDAVYREMFEHNPHPMWVQERDTHRFLDVNDAAIARYGYSREEFLAMTTVALSPAKQGSNTGTPRINSGGAWQHCTKNGQILYVELSSHNVDFQGHKAHLVLAYEVTDRLHAEALLHESERFANATIDSLALNIAVLDQQGTIIATNEGWRQFAVENGGDPATTGVGANYIEVCRKAMAETLDAGRVLTGLEQLIDGNIQHFSYEYSCHGPDKERWEILHLSRFPDDGPVYIVASHDDVTLRKQAELEQKRLNRYYDALRDMSRAIIRIEDSQELLKAVCQIAADKGELDLVWVGDPNEPRFGSVEKCGSASEYLDEFLNNHYNPLTRKRLSDQIITSRQPMVINDITQNNAVSQWAKLIEHHQLFSLVICPILGRDKIWGIIVFHARERNFFIPDLVHLLEELTADLAYGLDMIAAERSRHEAEAKLLLNAEIIESSHEGMFITGEDNRFTMVNRAFCDITGYSEEELIGNHPQLLGSGLHDQQFYQAIWQSLLDHGRWEGEIWDRRKNGQIYPVLLVMTRVRDDNSGNIYHIAIYRDITHRKEYEQQIEHIATHDILTDLPNRVLLDDRINQAIALAKRNERKLAVLFIDLDKFKLINDTLGHDIGDRLLKEIAGRIVAVLRRSDSISRIGGDEFVALVYDVETPEQIALVADKVITEISKPCNIDNHELVVTASIGIAMYPDSSDSPSELIRLADLAMIQAKHSGHDRFSFYSGQLSADANEYLYIQYQLRSAIPRNEIYLVYQPQCELNSNGVIGCEVLARWQHPRMGNISPARFIPIAEDSGLIVELGNWVLEESCKQLKSWINQSLFDSPVSVNVSALQFRQRDFVETVHAILNATGLPPEKLELEVTESILMRDFDDVQEKLTNLHHLGVKLAIDDFGTGYSSLAYLRQFPAHRLKIDKSFIQDLPHNPDASAITRAVVSLGSTLNMDIIAEGVETPEQAEFLSGIQCKQGQGYLYGKPMKPADFIEWLKQWHATTGRP